MEATTITLGNGKADSYEGRSFDAHLNILPSRPMSLTANSNLTQNPGY